MRCICEGVFLSERGVFATVGMRVRLCEDVCL